MLSESEGFEFDPLGVSGGKSESLQDLRSRAMTIFKEFLNSESTTKHIDTSKSDWLEPAEIEGILC